jgi:hypothetical protein
MPAPLGINNNSKTWPLEHVERLRKYFADGLSHQQIADQINLDFPGASYSRNASIGKANRLGLNQDIRPPDWSPRHVQASHEALSAGQRARYDRERAEGRHPPRSLSAAAPARPIPQFHRDNLSGLRCAEVDPLNVTLLELEEHQCRWPMTGWPAPGPTLFCGQIRCQEHESYCFAHWQLSIGAGTASERAAHRNEKVA